jgi:hypothetical protein
VQHVTSQAAYVTGTYLLSRTVVAATKLHASRSQQNRTTLQNKQQRTGEWKQFRTRSVAKLATRSAIRGGGGVNSLSGLEACNLVMATIVFLQHTTYQTKFLHTVSWFRHKMHICEIKCNFYKSKDKGNKKIFELLKYIFFAYLSVEFTSGLCVRKTFKHL